MPRATLLISPGAQMSARACLNPSSSPVHCAGSPDIAAWAWGSCGEVRAIQGFWNISFWGGLLHRHWDLKLCAATCR